MKKKLVAPDIRQGLTFGETGLLSFLLIFLVLFLAKTVHGKMDCREWGSIVWWPKWIIRYFCYFYKA